MLLIILAITTLTALFIIPRVRLSGAANDRLGSMSPQWLAEYRASRDQ